MSKLREKTKDKNIYYNTKTGKYDIKYNYKIYNPVKQKNEYKAKWIYNINTVTEAKKQLGKRAGSVKKALLFTPPSFFLLQLY